MTVAKKTLDETMADAKFCATEYAAKNKSDSFAYARAHNAVMSGWLSIHDFKELSYNPHI